MGDSQERKPPVLLQMVVGPEKKGRGPVSFTIRVLLSLLVAMLLFEGMVTAFHLLNLPSNRAVVGGVCLLLGTAAGGFFALRAIWKRKRLYVRVR